MKLYLSSFHLGSRPELFGEMFIGNKQVGLILAAGDAWGNESRTRRVIKQSEALATLGLEAIDVDLRTYFGRADELRNALADLGGVWVPGGNTFVLRRAMRDSGFDEIVGEMLLADKPYGGYSAGICVLATSLVGIHLADDPSAVERVFSKEIIWEGLGLLPYLPIPHYKSNHVESPLMDEVVAFMEREGLPYRTLRDGEVIIA